MLLALDYQGRRYDSGNLEGYLEATVDRALKDRKISPWFKDYILKKAERYRRELIKGIK